MSESDTFAQTSVVTEPLLGVAVGPLIAADKQGVDRIMLGLHPDENGRNICVDWQTGYQLQQV